MAIRMICKDGEAVLRKKSKPVGRINDRVTQLIDDMVETLKDANGVGLAAPQVGILKRIIVIDASGEEGAEPIVLINPEITARSGAQSYYEGCLSFPGYYGDVGRPEAVTVAALDRNGARVEYDAEGLFAVACCHEIDHLDGVMFMDKVKGRLYSAEEIRQMREKEAEKADKPDKPDKTEKTEAAAKA
ncbi:MAG: peptide deformylase [Clostridiales bacterium]|nr:peptide deformylase [Clostridiales bacterium]